MNRTLAKELQRRKAVEKQMKDLLDKAAEPQSIGSGIINLGRAMLFAEMYERNETTKAPYDEAITAFVQVLHQRSQQVVCWSWQTPVMPVKAYGYFHTHCIERHPPRVQAAARGEIRRAALEQITPGTKCDHCGGLLGEPERGLYIHLREE